MVYFVDNFLDKKILDFVIKDLNSFKKVDTPGKSFWIKNATNEFIDYICKRLQLIENKKITNILAFFREAKKNQDDKWRIHNDSIIENKQPDRAIVLYLSDNKLKKINGTAFWKHKKYGDTYKSTNAEEFNRMLKEDAEDLKKWDVKSIIGHKKNRLLSYPCNYFHSKYPNKFKESRIVFVMFYKYENL